MTGAVAFFALGGADLEVSDDGAFVFFATQRNSVEQLAGALSSGEPAGPRGISVVDVRDPARPRLSFYLPLPANGPHTLTYHKHLDGNEYLIACTYDLVTDPGTGAIVGAAPVTQRVLIYEIVAAGDDRALVPVGQYQVLAAPRDGSLVFPHDATVQVHPYDQRTLMYVAYWDVGADIVDISDPTRPQRVALHSDFSPSSLNAIHLVRPFDEPIGERHVTVTEPEVISADETGHVFFLDTTDPTSPRRLGHWTLPGDLVVQNLDFSPHNFDPFDGKIALAHYHAGIWVVDVSDEENLAAPKSVGFYMPAPARDGSPYPQPYVWGVLEHEGLLYASDWSTGLHILRYTGP